MQFEFEVGDTEKHRVQFRRDRWSGNVTIKADDQCIVSTGGQAFSFQLVREYNFTLGEAEEHTVRIEHSWPLLVAGSHEHTYRVFVDGHTIQEHRGF